MANLCSPAPAWITQEEWDEAIELAERWKEVRTDESYGPQGKALGLMARAFLHMKACYEQSRDD